MSHFRASDLQRKRSTVVPSDRIEHFHDDRRRSSSRASFKAKTGDPTAWAEKSNCGREAEAAAESITTVETGRVEQPHGRDITRDYERLLLNTLIHLKQATEDNLACSKSTIGILDTAITAMQQCQSQLVEEEDSTTTATTTEESSFWSVCWASTWWPWNYLYWKFKRSALISLLEGNNLLIGECDEIVNALILVNALVLTIPFAIIPDLHFAYWAQLKEYMDLCDSNTLRPFDQVRDIYRSSTLAVIFTSIGSIIVACVYYLFRPRHDNTFQQWWARGGRDAMALLILGTGVSVVNIFFLTSYIFHYYSVHPDWLCDPSHSDRAISFCWISLCVVFVYVTVRLL